MGCVEGWINGAQSFQAAGMYATLAVIGSTLCRSCCFLFFGFLDMLFARFSTQHHSQSRLHHWASHAVPAPQRPCFMQHQSWHDALCLHYSVDPALIARLLPSGLEPAIFETQAWLSVIILREEGVKPWHTPTCLHRWLAVSHGAMNLRTYVRSSRDAPVGIYFLSLEASSVVATVGARALFGLPYHLARMDWRWAEAAEGHTRTASFVSSRRAAGGVLRE